MSELSADEMLLGGLELELTNDGVGLVSQEPTEWADESLVKRSDLDTDDGAEVVVVSQDDTELVEG